MNLILYDFSVNMISTVLILFLQLTVRNRVYHRYRSCRCPQSRRFNNNPGLSSADTDLLQKFFWNNFSNISLHFLSLKIHWENSAILELSTIISGFLVHSIESESFPIKPKRVGQFPIARSLVCLSLVDSINRAGTVMKYRCPLHAVISLVSSLIAFL